MRLFLIEWLDSHVSIGGWRELEGYTSEAPTVRSVGWLWQDGKTTKILVPHVIENREPDIPLQGCGEMVIPCSAIVTMTELMAPNERTRQGI